MIFKTKIRRILIWLFIPLLFAAIAWAVDAFLAQADKIAIGAADAGAKSELANIQLTTINPGAPSSFDWAEADKYNSQMEANTKTYGELLARASAEKQAGPLSPATRDAGMACADEFNKLSSELAVLYEKGNYPLRAKTALEAGSARIKNAQMAFSPLESASLDALRVQSDSMFKAAMANLDEFNDSTDPKASFAIAKLAMYIDRKVNKQLNKLSSQAQELQKQYNEHLHNQVKQGLSDIKKNLKAKNMPPATLNMLDDGMKMMEQTHARLKKNMPSNEELMKMHNNALEEAYNMQDKLIQEMEEKGDFSDFMPLASLKAQLAARKDALAFNEKMQADMKKKLQEMDKLIEEQAKKSKMGSRFLAQRKAMKENAKKIIEKDPLLKSMVAMGELIKNLNVNNMKFQIKALEVSIAIQERSQNARP